MDILKHVEKSDRFGRDAVALMYGQAPLKKLNRKDYQDKIEKTHLHSKVSICAAILAEHKRNPYASVEDILGDLQVVLSDSWNEFRKLEPNKIKIEIEDLVDATAAVS